MYYVETNKDEYTITTSYATKAQAQRFSSGNYIVTGERHLLKLDGGETTVDEYKLDAEVDCVDLGRVRTEFSRYADIPSDRYHVYVDAASEEECENGIQKHVYTGIAFGDYGEANRFLKSKSLYGDFLIIENPNFSQAMDSRGSSFSIDTSRVNCEVYD